MTDSVHDLRDTVIPKSDQLNAEDLLSGPLTVRIEAASDFADLFEVKDALVKMDAIMATYKFTDARIKAAAVTMVEPPALRPMRSSHGVPDRSASLRAR